MTRMLGLCFLLLFLGTYAVGAQDSPKGLSTEERTEYDLIQRRLREQNDLLEAAGWTLAHCADAKEVRSAERTVRLLSAFEDESQRGLLTEIGGPKGFVTEVASLIGNKDPVVRGFAALLLAVVGNGTHKSDIAGLLADKPDPPQGGVRDLSRNFDRSRAAMALGLLGAREYAPQLAALLVSTDPMDRVGTALGLGLMGAKEYAPAIAKLLSDDCDEAKAAAIQALAELGAVEYSKAISRLLTSGGDPSVSETACFALARLGAKEQAVALASLLQDEFRRGDAAKALALLGSNDFAKNIASLIGESDGPARGDGLIALGILDAKEYATNVLAGLDDDNPYVRDCAAVALLLMRNQASPSRTIAIVRPGGAPPRMTFDDENIEAAISGPLELHSVVAKQRQQLILRANEEWKRQYQRARGNQPSAPPTEVQRNPPRTK